MLEAHSPSTQLLSLYLPDYDHVGVYLLHLTDISFALLFALLHRFGRDNIQHQHTGWLVTTSYTVLSHVISKVIANTCTGLHRCFFVMADRRKGEYCH